LSGRNTAETGVDDHQHVLRGFTIGITADRRWDEQATLFARRGAAVQHGPSIRTLPLGDDDRLRAATDAVIARRPAILIANTGIGIRSWISSAELWGKGDELTDALRASRIFARGPKAAGVAHAHGLEVEDRALTERLCDAVDLAIAVLRPGDLVALQLDGRGASVEADRLRAAGADVLEIPVYLWELPEDIGPAVRLAEAAVAGKVHAVTFTAGPAIRNWLAIADSHGLGDELRATLTDGRVVVGCVGPVCEDTAVAAGLGSDQIVVPRTWRLGPLVRAVADRLIERTVRLDVGGTNLCIAGNLVTIGERPVVFTDTEAQVLTLLAARPNVVHPKAELLRTVWRDEHADPHVVEVAVARMRRRMGVLGGSITSVYRRGYTLKTH
jgi:uroporphyrinogen-III synthase